MFRFIDFDIYIYVLFCHLFMHLAGSEFNNNNKQSEHIVHTLYTSHMFVCMYASVCLCACCCFLTFYFEFLLFFRTKMIIKLFTSKQCNLQQFVVLPFVSDTV